MKKLINVLVIIVLLVGALWLGNYLLIAKPVQNKITADPRNQGIALSGHYRYYVLPTSLVLNLTEVEGSHTRLDVLRTVLQASEVLKDKSFNEVILAFKGTGKFKIGGDYFKELGQTYDTQNPLYTVRTFAEHVTDMKGVKPYGQLQGGVFGVLAGGMEQFSDFSKKWYGHDLSLGHE